MNQKFSVEILPPFRGTIYNEKYSASEKSERVILIFHGFPSSQNKNEHIAEYLTQQLKADVFIFHYEGLGQSQGLFSFENSIQDAISYYKMVKAQGYRSVSLIGHSWGGLVALNLITTIESALLPNQLILLSPLNNIPVGDALMGLVDSLYAGSKESFKQSKETMAQQISVVASHYNPRHKIEELKSLKMPIHIIQASDDDKVHPQSTASFVDLIDSNHVQFEFLDTDHRFQTNQPHFLQRLAEVLS